MPNPTDFKYNDNIIDHEEVQKCLDLIGLMKYYVLPACPDEELRTAIEESPYDCAQNVVALMKMMTDHLAQLGPDQALMVPNSDGLGGDASEDKVIDISGMVGGDNDES